MKNTRAGLTKKLKLLAPALACVLVLGVCFGCSRVTYTCDFYSGKYVRETDTLELDHTFSAESNVRVSVNKIELDDSIEPANKITLELTSTVDQTQTISLTSQSGDVIFEGDSKVVVLKAGQAQSVELNFGGWQKYRYVIGISVDNTRLELVIDP